MLIKILTLNLYEGGLLFSNIKPFLLQENPDIICLQEVYNSNNSNLPECLRSLSVIQDLFPNYTHHFAPELLVTRKNPAEGQIELGNAIFTKFPIINFSTTHFDIPYGTYPQWAPGADYSKYPQNCHLVDLNINSHPLRVINLHGIWGLDGGDNPRRLQMSQTIINQFSGALNIILAGDFNLQPHTQTIANIEDHLTNIFKDELTSTFNMKHKTNPGYASAVVDMIFASPHLSLQDHYKDTLADVSDHIPLIATLDLGN